MYREGVRGQRQRQRSETSRPSERETPALPRYRVTALLDARAHRIKHRSRATVRARSSMEKSALLFVSPSFAPRRYPTAYARPAGRGSRRGQALHPITCRRGTVRRDASSRPHAHVRWGSIPALARSRPCSQRLPPTPRQPAHERRDPQLARAQSTAETRFKV